MMIKVIQMIKPIATKLVTIKPIVKKVLMSEVKRKRILMSTKPNYGTFLKPR